VGIATVFRHFPTKDALVEATLLQHFEDLTARAEALAESPDPAKALRTLVRVMIETGATKITLASLIGKHGEFPPPPGQRRTSSAVPSMSCCAALRESAPQGVPLQSMRCIC
jgi:AcrR family transcriptional regulator